MPEVPDPGRAPGSDSDSDTRAAAGPPHHRIALKIFLGADGVRAGWSLLLFAALVFVLLQLSAACSEMLLRHFSPAPATGGAVFRPALILVGEGLAFAAVAIATWAMSRAERRPNSAYGLASRRGLHNFLAGLACGVALLSLLVFALHACGLLVFDGRLLFGPGALRYGAVWLAGFLLLGLFEEYLTRGFVQFTLTRGLRGVFAWLGAAEADALGFWSAALLTSFYFCLGHRSNPGESRLGLLTAGLIGMVFCLSLWRTGSLWWAIGFHASWDWAQSFLYGVADSGGMVQGHLFATHPAGRPIFSGGLTGPEGSLLALPIVALAAGVILITLPRTRPETHPNQESPELQALSPDHRPAARERPLH